MSMLLKVATIAFAGLMMSSALEAAVRARTSATTGARSSVSGSSGRASGVIAAQTTIAGGAPNARFSGKRTTITVNRTAWNNFRRDLGAVNHDVVEMSRSGG